MPKVLSFTEGFLFPHVVVRLLKWLKGITDAVNEPIILGILTPSSTS
jgi:hypothetical protein